MKKRIKAPEGEPLFQAAYEVMLDPEVKEKTEEKTKLRKREEKEPSVSYGVRVFVPRLIDGKVDGVMELPSYRRFFMIKTPKSVAFVEGLQKTMRARKGACIVIDEGHVVVETRDNQAEGWVIESWR